MRSNHRFLNFTDHKGTHHTQPSYVEAKAKLWEAYNEMVKRNEAWRKQWDTGGTEGLNERAINNYYEIKLLQNE